MEQVAWESRGRCGPGPLLSQTCDPCSNKHARTAVQVHALLPYSAGDLLNDLHTGGRVKNLEYKEVRTGSVLAGKE